MPSPQDAQIHHLQLSAGKFDTRNGSDAASLAKTFQTIAESPSKNLVVHFHGGLVGREDAWASAQRLAPLYKSKGAESLFVIWETSAKEIAAQNVDRIINEPIFQSILERVTEFVKGKLAKSAGAKSVSTLERTMGTEIQAELKKGQLGEAMFSDEEFAKPSPEQVPSPESALTPEEQQYIEDEIDRDDEIKSHMEAILAAPEPGSRGVDATAPVGTLPEKTLPEKTLPEKTLPEKTLPEKTLPEKTLPEKTLMDKEVIAREAPLAEDGQSRSIVGTILLGKRVVTIVGAVVWRYAAGRDHGLYLTIVEEIMRAFYVRAAGRFLWTEMKDAVGRAFEEGSGGGGRAFLDELQSYWNASKACVTLVGHSAGSIYVARLLQELNTKMDPGFRVNVILIAPACTFDVLAEALDKAGNRVANLRIFGMSDQVELNDHLAKGFYPASLLYFVSGVLEDDRDQPLAGMERYYAPSRYGDTFKTIAGVKAFRALSGEHSYAWSQAGGFDGANCDMVHHGGWADAPATLASVLHLIQGGCSDAW